MARQYQAHGAHAVRSLGPVPALWGASVYAKVQEAGTAMQALRVQVADCRKRSPA